MTKRQMSARTMDNGQNIYLDDSCTGNRAKTLCDDIEQSLQNAAVSADQQTACYSWIDMTSTNMAECLK